MIKRILQFLFLWTICISAYSQAAGNYNIIATAYVTTTISQKVVFDATMQQGGTFDFGVLAHNGGGRAGQSDTANVKIQFYTAAGALVSSVNSSYSNNLLNPNASAGNPAADPTVPWSTVSISSTNCGGSCSNVAYATISMYGIDGSYWAGDYGPWYRAPTFTLNGGGNLAYNPEFGPYNNITAQGWTSSPGFAACQGAWGGSNACIVNSSGTPGTNTTGLVANTNGGGPSATGGTTSGTAGGYNSTMSTTNAAGAPPKTVTGTSTSYTTSSTVNGSTTSNYRTPVTTTTWSDGTTSTSTGTASLYTTVSSSNTIRELIIGADSYKFSIVTTTTTYANGSGSTVSYSGYFSSGDVNVSGDNQTYVQIFEGNSNTSSWAALQNIVTGSSWYCPTCTITSGTVLSVWSDGAGSLYFAIADSNGNPVISESKAYYFSTIAPTVRPAFDGTLTQTNNPATQTVTSGGSSAAGITTDQQTRVNAWNTRVLNSGNIIGLTVSGSGNAFIIEQVGSKNLFTGIGQASAAVQGDNNNVTIKQGVTGAGQNEIDFKLGGTGNIVKESQARDANGNALGTNGHYQSTDIGGFGNVLTITQSNTTLGSQYMETSIYGNGNNVTASQTDNGNKTMFTKVSGDINTVTATQSGTGQHQLTTSLTGSRNSATVAQSGSVANNASIDLTNAGGAASIDLIQTGGKNFTIQQSCVNMSGCSTTVRQ